MPPPPPPPPLPPVIVSPEKDPVTFESTRNTRLALLPLTVTPAAGPVIVVAPVVSLSSSWLPPRVIVFAVLNTVLSKTIVSGPAFAFAWAIASRRSVWPATCVSVGLFTVKVEGQQRPSSASRARRIRRGALRIVRVTGRLNSLRIQERIVMGNSRSVASQGNISSDGSPDPPDGSGEPSYARTVAATSPRHSVVTTKELSSNCSSPLISSGNCRLRLSWPKVNRLRMVPKIAYGLPKETT